METIINGFQSTINLPKCRTIIKKKDLEIIRNGNRISVNIDNYHNNS